MPSDLQIIKGPYFRDLLDQPRAIAATVNGLAVSPALAETLAHVSAGRFSRIVLTGMGSSLHALHPLHIRLIDCGYNAVMEETSELLHYKSRLLDRDPVVIAVSQSGRSAEIVRLLEAAARCSTLIGVTNTPGSPLATAAGATVMTNAGDEFSVSCKTYVATLAALSWLGDLLAGVDPQQTRGELTEAAVVVADYLAGWEHHVEELIEDFRDVQRLFLAGRGPSLAAANTGALIIKESDHFPAEGMTCAAFRHGPFEMVSRNTLVVVFAGPDKTRHLNTALVRDIRERGGRAELVSDRAGSGVFRIPAAPPASAPILEILPIQMITLALAAQAGREPGAFTLASKITTVE